MRRSTGLLPRSAEERRQGSAIGTPAGPARREAAQHHQAIGGLNGTASLHVSIVGLDEASLPYVRVKLAGERMVRESGLSWSVVRATPFYYLLESVLAGFAWLPVWPVPKAVCNPVDTSDVADYLVHCAFDGVRGERAEIGGPEDLTLVEYARQYLAARGMNRTVMPIHVSDKTARGMGFVKSKGVRGTLSWRDWLRRRLAEGLKAA